MLETLIIGMLPAAVLLLPVAVIVAIMEAAERGKKRREDRSRYARYETQEDADRRLRNAKEDARIRRIWEDEAEELERT